MNLDVKYGSVKEYYRKVVQEKQGNHGDFLAAVQVWIEKHNSNPTMARLRDTDAIKTPVRKILTEDRVGNRLVAPKRQFVLAENWNEAKYGKLSEQVVCERFVFGQVKKGVYRRVGEDGHFDVEDYDESSMVTSGKSFQRCPWPSGARTVNLKRRLCANFYRPQGFFGEAPAQHASFRERGCHWG